jgi:phosphotransacetylase
VSSPTSGDGPEADTRRILREAERIVSGGIKEIILIARHDGLRVRI